MQAFSVIFHDCDPDFGLKAELPVYLAAAEDVNVLNEEQKVEWWHKQEERLPRWVTAVKQVLLIQPSSAAAERVFSILKASFNEQQDCALVDYIQASVMAQQAISARNCLQYTSLY